jgi:two-component system, NarL family, invasion response regulator UvrY
VIRLLILDHLRTLCDAMRVILKDEMDICVVGVAVSVEEAVPQVDNCDVVLVSAALPDSQALQFVQRVVQDHPGVKVLVMDVGTGDVSAQPYFAAGAAGCIHEEHSIDDLLSRMRLVAANRRPFHAGLTRNPR